MFFLMGLCMALVQGGYVRRIAHGKEIQAARRVRHVYWVEENVCS